MNRSCSNIVTKEEIAYILGNFIERNPYAFQIKDILCNTFEEGFGLNTDLTLVQIIYGAQHLAYAPSKLIIKQYKSDLVGITSEKPNARKIHERELDTGKVANTRFFLPGDGTRLFPTYFNAVSESEEDSTIVKETLKKLKERRIIVMDCIGDNLDRRLSDLIQQYTRLKKEIQCPSSGQNVSIIQKAQDTLRTKVKNLEQEVVDIVGRALTTTRYFHDQLKEINNSEDASILGNYMIGKNKILTKFMRYNHMLSEKTINNNARKKLDTYYKPTRDLICGLDEKTKELAGVIHADLHHLNIILDDNAQIRFTDAANITRKGATYAFDIAPQLFNPTVVSFHPEKAIELIKRYYLGKNSKQLENLVLATLLSGHNWCFKGATANEGSMEQAEGQYKIFLAKHPNHRNAIPLYLGLADVLLDFIIENHSSFNLSDEQLDSIKSLREVEFQIHKEPIEEGKKHLELIR